MPYAVADANAVEAEREGRVRRIRTALGVSAFGINHLHLEPGQTGSEHDESTTGQEEVYFVLEGSGTMAVEDEEVVLAPGRFVFVPPGTMRQVRAGDRGLTWLCVGCPPGCYRPRA
jgi:mannose-6-phosphate isomerase-like protein (cupin superfamily)